MLVLSIDVSDWRARAGHTSGIALIVVAPNRAELEELLVLHPATTPWYALAYSE